MKCISFPRFRSNVQPLRKEIERLEKIAESSHPMKANEAYSKLLLLVNCLDIACTQEYSDFKQLIDGKLNFLESNLMTYYDDRLQQTITVDRFQIIKKIQGKGSDINKKLANQVRSSPLFEFRINANNYGFRSLFFISAKEMSDIFDAYQCHMNWFTKSVYTSESEQIKGHLQLNRELRPAVEQYSTFRRDEMSFKKYFAEDQVIAGR